MKRATSIVQGSLRLVSLVITLVTVATFATIGYSAYQEYGVLVSPQSSQNLKVQTTVVGGALRLTVAGSIPNNGLYPLDFSVSLAAESSGVVLAQSSSQPVRILPKEIKTFNISLDINPYDTSNKTAQSFLLTNGGQVTILTGIQANIEPFAGLRVEGGSNFTLPALVGDLRAGPAEVSFSAGHTIVAVPISFVNKANFAFPFSIHAILRDDNGNVLANSADISGISDPGKETNFKLDFTLTGRVTFSGGYPLELDFSVAGLQVAVQTRVQVSNS